jgi:hypothetical protein
MSEKLQAKSRKKRFAANGEPPQTPQHPGFNAGSGPIAERTALLRKGKKKTNLSGPFASIDHAVSSIASADSSFHK